MSDTTFQSLVTPITTTWAQDVNNATYRAIGTGLGGTAPTSPADVRTNLGLTAQTGASLIGVTPTGTVTATNVQNAIAQLASGGVSSAVTTITSFGGIGDGVTENATAFIAAEASSADKIFLPNGTYKVTGITLAKPYYGDGRILLDGVYYGQTYSDIRTAPTTTNYANYGIDGDISHVNVESNTLENVRNGLDAFYFNAPTTPHFAWFKNFAGHSGIDALLTANANAGTNTLVVNAVPTDCTIGSKVGLANTSNPITPIETVTVTNVVGNTITVTPNLTNSYVVGNSITLHARTMNQQHFVQVDHYGGGDAYCFTGRISAWGNNNNQAGQNHVYAKSTVGVIGGDLFGGKDGTYLTSTEFNMLDTTYLGNSNISAISHVNSFQRTTDPRSSITTTLSAGASAGASSITVTSGAGMLTSGGTVTIIGSTVSETQYISSVSGTTVNLLLPLEYTHSGGETVIYQSQGYRTTLSSGASSGATSITVASNTGIIAGDSVLTITDGVKYSVNSVANVVGTTITLGNALENTFSSGAAVVIQNSTTNPYGTTWIGALYKSESTKSGDAIISGYGKWKTGINLTRADFSAFSQAAIQLAPGQRIYFNSYYGADVAKNALWGNVPGDCYMAVNPQVNSLQTWYNNRLVSETDGVYQYFRKQAYMVAGGSVATNSFFRLDGPTGTNYFKYNGSYMSYSVGGTEVIACNATNTWINNTPNLNGIVNFFNSTVSPTASAGVAVLPANPYTFLTISINNNNYKIPVYNV